MKRTLLGLVLLLGLSLLFLLGLAGYVKLTQPRPLGSDPLRVMVQEDILWPGKGAQLLIAFDPPPAISSKPQAMDLVLLLDTSGSMQDQELSLAKQAAVTFLKNIGAGRHDIKVGVIQFADTAKVMSSLSVDLPQTTQTLAVLQPEAGGGTRFLPALEEALSLLRGSSNGKAVLLTDGAAGEDESSLRTFFEQTWTPSRHELFLLGIGDEVDQFKLQQLTDDPLRYLITSLDKAAPITLFDGVARDLGNFVGDNSWLTLPLAEPLVEWRKLEMSQDLSSDMQPLPFTEKLHAEHWLGPLFARPYQWSAGIAPKFGGILPVLHDPVTLEYLDHAGKRHTLTSADRSPRVLAVTPWFLFVLLLPALLYLLAKLLAWWMRPQAVIPELPPLPRPKKPVPPTALPHYAVDSRRLIHWSPTLLIGLGRSGRQVLTHVHQALKDTQDVAAERPLLLALDVARDEVYGPSPERVPACLDPLSQDEIFLLPETACNLQGRIMRRLDPTDPASALDLQPYRNYRPEALSLRTGTHGEAPLARLALLNDLAQGDRSALLQRLNAALADCKKISPEVPERQIILVGNVEGGITRGWLSDLLILLRRKVAEDERVVCPVEILVLLLGSPAVYDPRLIPLRSDTLFDELDRLASAGRLPFRHTLARGTDQNAGLMDGVVDRRPQDDILVMSGAKSRWEQELFPAAADALLLVMDPDRRAELMFTLESVKQEENERRATQGVELYTELALHSAALPHLFYARLLSLRLVQILLGDEVLFPGMEYAEEAVRLSVVGEGKPAFPLPDKTGHHPLSNLDLIAGIAAGLPYSIPLPKDEDDLQEAGHDFLLLLQQTWEAYLHQSNWNLATVVKFARQGANNLRHHTTAGSTLHELAGVLDEFAGQALRWITLLLGEHTDRQVQGEIAPGTITDTGWLPEAIRDYTETRTRMQEWAQNPARILVGYPNPVSAGKPSSPEDVLLEKWLAQWLSAKGDVITQLRQRCRWEILVPGTSGERLGLSLSFLGSETFRFPPTGAGVSNFKALLGKQVSESIGLVTNLELLPLLASSLPSGPERTLDEFAARLKGEMRGDRATLLVSMPGWQSSDSLEVRKLCTDLQQALNRQAGAAEILRFHESKDPYQLLLLRLMPLKHAQPRERVPQVPVHRYERYRRDYAMGLAEEMGLTQVDLPVAAGIALADETKLTRFAGLWLEGKILQDKITGLIYVIADDGKYHPLTFFPNEGLAEAAARFVTKGMHASVSPKTDCQIEQFHESFEALLCWLWTNKK